MILLVSTLGVGPAEQNFYRRIEQNVGAESVLTITIDAAPAIVSDRHLAVGWDLRAPSMGWAEAAQTPDAESLTHWVERWSRCTRVPGETLAPSISRFAAWVSELLDQVRPSLVLVSSTSVPHTGIPHEIAARRGIDHATFERGYLPDSFQFAVGGSGPFSHVSDLSAQTLGTAATSPVNAAWIAAGEHQIDILTRFGGRRDVPQVDPPPEEEFLTSPDGDARRPRVLFVPVADASFSVFPVDHPDHDRIMPFFVDSPSIAAELAADPSLDVVTKPHPTEKDDPKWQQPDVGRVTHGDPIAWLRWADVVVCNGSTLEFAALAHRKPVVLAGRSVLSNKGIAYEVRQRGQLIQMILTALRDASYETRREAFVRFTGWLACEHLIFCADESHVDAALCREWKYHRNISTLRRCWDSLWHHRSRQRLRRWMISTIADASPDFGDAKTFQHHRAA